MSRSPQPHLHVAIIMDGNGRWAEQRGLPRSAGHVAGALAVKRVVRAALALPISDLTLFALSSENWRRPRAELDAILELLHRYLESQTASCVANGVRLCVIGRRDRLSSELLAAIEASERATAHGERLALRLAIDYSSRDAIVRAARRFNVQAALGEPRDGFGRLIAHDDRMTGDVGDVDLLVRSGGEQRLSDFLLWECAWAEIVFTRRMWPEFGGAALKHAIEVFYRRERRYGGIDTADATPPGRSRRPA